MAVGHCRPLHDDMMIYARTDAHYLPYIASCLQHELLAAKQSKGKPAPIDLALQRSANVSRRLYEKPTSEVKHQTLDQAMHDDALGADVLQVVTL